MEYLLTIFALSLCVRFVLLLMQAGAGWIMTARLRHRVDSSAQVERETDYSCYIRKTRDVSVATTPPKAPLHWRPNWSDSTANRRSFLCHQHQTCMRTMTVFRQVSNILNRTLISPAKYSYASLICIWPSFRSFWSEQWVSWRLVCKQLLFLQFNFLPQNDKHT